MKKMSMRRRTISRLVSYALAALVVLAGFVYRNYRVAEDYKLQLTNTYKHAFSEVSESANSIDTALKKALCAGSCEMVTSLSDEVYGRAVSARLALSELPTSTGALDRTAAFITRVGDWSRAMSRKAATGEQLTEEEYRTLTQFSATASELSLSLAALADELTGGDERLFDVESDALFSSRFRKNAQKSTFSGGIEQVESELPISPDIVYDGPFSSHIDLRTPKMTDGRGALSQDEAGGIASRFLGVQRTTVRYDCECDGGVPCYTFTAQRGGASVSANITKNGGYPLDVISSRVVQNAVIAPDAAAGLAARFLEKHGYSNMKMTWYASQNNIATVNFAAAQGDVVCYPDLVKVSIALDNGEVTGFEARGYVMNHVLRTMPEERVSERSATARVSPRLHVVGHQMAIIPTAGLNEVYCHEFKCETPSGGKCLVYLNAVNGCEERILLLPDGAAAV